MASWSNRKQQRSRRRRAHVHAEGWLLAVAAPRASVTAELDRQATELRKTHPTAA